PAAWQALIDVNVNGAFNVLRAFLPGLLGSGDAGHVVMMSSVGGLSVGAGQSGYIASKFAMRVMGQCLREDLRRIDAPVGVTVVLPGPVRTNIFKNAATGGAAGAAQRTELAQMLERYGLEPVEVAEMVFRSIEADEFWLHTHPEMSREAIDEQHRELLSAF
ncbi:SDR family oxidoreductase, partial [Bacillus cereus]|uniref:SDR family oxidoreductase n=1 Tax=Bacillus cereus TaxID=1396 RepID=UPI003671BFA1